MATVELTPRVKLAAAVTRLTNAKNGWMPYFAAVLTGLIRVETDEIETLAVSADGRLYWCPAWVRRNTVDIIAMGLAHETLHVTLRHFARSEALGIKCPAGAPVAPEVQHLAHLANLAQDACINEQLREVAVPQGPGQGVAKLPLPASWVYPESLGQPTGLVFEERFRRLRQDRPKPPPQGGGGEGQGQGQPQPGDGSGGLGSGRCGSCANHPAEGEPRGEGTGKDGGRSEAELDRIRRQVAGAVKEYVQKGRGTVPSDLQRWADETLAPAKIDWRTQLQQITRAALAYRPGSVSYHWRKPSRRQGGIGYGPGVAVLPAMHAPVPDVAVIVDTSGSMGPDDLAAACSEVKGVLLGVGAKITVVSCDADVHGVTECETIEQACQALRGGGGTDMTPGFTELAKRIPRPDVVIVLTDTAIGNGYPQDEPTWCRTVWVGIGKYAKRPCPWGEYVQIDEGAGQPEAALRGVA
jgi:predicted metal-dependent peptidase